MYTFLLVSPSGAIPAFAFEECCDDEAARREAERLLQQHQERRAVEVWSERERVWVVSRD